MTNYQEDMRLLEIFNKSGLRIEDINNFIEDTDNIKLTHKPNIIKTQDDFYRDNHILLLDNCKKYREKNNYKIQCNICDCYISKLSLKKHTSTHKHLKSFNKLYYRTGLSIEDINNFIKDTLI